MSDYYDGTKLLSMKDINNKTPEIFMVTSNRTGGKTTYFGRLLMNRWFKKGEKFCLIYRYKYELDDCAEKFFKDIGALFFKNYYMTSQPKAKGCYHELYISNIYDEEGNERELCGYAIALNSADIIKKNSHLFCEVQAMLFDEFQSETNHYCTDELSKFISVHISIARGRGQQVRYVPVYMCANPVTILNPYYVSMHISERLHDDTNFLRGDGFVLEQGYNKGASEAQENSGFNRAFSSEKYVAYAAQAVYLNDNKAFIETPTGKNQYTCTIRYKDRDFCLREYTESGIMYCGDSVDSSFPYRVSVTTDDHNVNYIMLKKNELMVLRMRYFFNRGCFRFKNLACKEALLALIALR